MKRSIEKNLLEWKKDKDHKVLLVRGARQVGKTYSIRKLSNTFDYFLEVNFEEDLSIHSFFKNSLNPNAICEKLSAYYNIPIKLNQTLLFFDEIQACPNALRALRFFYEKIPDLHVIAAGSLLEFTLSEIPSFGVGRISNLFMYPMTFKEFLQAIDEEGLIYLLDSQSEIDQVFHLKLMDIYRHFLMIGGMPAIVENYRKNHNLRKCQVLLDELITAIQDDFNKYKKNYTVPIIREVFYSVMQQVGQKFKYSNISTDIKIYHYKISLDLLEKAGLVHKIYHTSAQGIPLGAQINTKKFKVIPWDMGIYQRLSGLDISDILASNSTELIHKGKLAELFAGLELTGNSNPFIKPHLLYWHRESRSSNAELDYVIQKGNQIIPLEVKAGVKGRMQSMKIFLKEKKLKKGIRISQENFCTYNGIQIIPVYAVGSLAC